jgi:TolB-like protein/Flp pilus assembly protein TadD
LKVISRTSTLRYQSKPPNLSHIAKQLGVANIVEGSVQKTADQVRVNVQLINAQTDSHLWADTYDRKLTDIFGVESEIAKGIAESLKIKLTGREEQVVTSRPTNSPEAYDWYLRGLAFEARSAPVASWEARSFYERAIQLDPKFAIAWARLARAESLLYIAHDESHGPITARADAAKLAVETAQRLEPDLPETLLAIGYYQYRVLRDYGAAKTTFGQVLKLFPGNSEAPYALGRVARLEGHFDQASAYLEQALTLDPGNMELVSAASDNYAVVKQFQAALRLCDRALDIKLNDPDTMARKAIIYQAEGNLQEAARFVPKISETSSNIVYNANIGQLQYERNFDELIRFCEAPLPHFASDMEKPFAQLALAFNQRLAGDTVGAKRTGEEMRNALERAYKDKEERHDWRARDPRVEEYLSRVYALIGKKDAALIVAERAVMLWPRAKDPVFGPAREENLAVVQTMVGENKRAISALSRLLKIPYASTFYSPTGVTPALLRLDPIWDPLRSDPAFQKLCEEKLDKSIAVLPFDNLGGDPNNAYFAEGIQEEILTRLGKIADLKVISRTSTKQYESKPGNLGEIAKQLGVTNVLEGSIQKVANQVRVNVQLINAQTDSHLWADTYDRKLTDILAVESEIAKRIAESLQAKLTGNEEQVLAAKPTNNPEAYDAYLRGLSLQARSAPFMSWEARTFFDKAVQLDPNFGVAWARLCRVDALLYKGRYDTYNGGTLAARAEAAKRALENAQRLEPNSPETLLALGYYQYWLLGDFGSAKTTFGRLGKMLPNSSEAPYALGRVTRREGHYDQSIPYFEQALALDPRNVELLNAAASTYAALKQFPAALKLYDRVLDVKPNDPDALADKASVYQAEGDLKQASSILSTITDVSSRKTSGTKASQLQLERNYGELIRLWQTRLVELHFDLEFDKAAVQLALAVTQQLAGDTASAKVTAEPARNILERLYRDQSNDANLLTVLSKTHAVMGENDSALNLAQRAVMLDPRTKDPVNGPTWEENLAVVQALVGDSSGAISTLSQLLHTPYDSWMYMPTGVTSALLKLDPIWDPLRGDPAFQKLCDEKQDLTTNGH